MFVLNPLKQSIKAMWLHDEARVYLVFAVVCTLVAAGLIAAVGVKSYYDHTSEDRTELFNKLCYDKGGFPIVLDKYVEGYGDKVCVESLKLLNIPDTP